MDEEWKAIEFAPDYQVSNHGNVRKRVGLDQFKLISPVRNNHVIGVNFHFNGFCKQRSLSKLVIDHFGPPKPSGFYDAVNADGNKLNNRIDNLEWIPRSHNRTQLRHIHTSKYHGVSLTRAKDGRQRWLAKLSTVHPFKRVVTKSFPYTPEGEIEAAMWRDSKAHELQGKKATLNFPEKFHQCIIVCGKEAHGETCC